MQTRVRIGTVAALAAAALGLSTGEAGATSCLNDNDHNCWRDLGMLAAEIAVGHSGLNGGGQGLVCAATNLGSVSWGGDIKCYRPVPNTTLSAFEAIVTNIVSGTENIFRARALALEPRGNGLRLHILRNDDYVFFTDIALTNGSVQTLGTWWYAAVPQLTNTTTPVIPREIQWSPTFGLMAVATDNRIYSRADDGKWKPLSVFMQPVNTVYLGSGIVPIVGTNGQSHVFNAPLPYNYFQPVGPPPAVTFALPFENPDPYYSFFFFGRTTPISCDNLAGCFVTADPPMVPLGASGAPSIYRSTYSSQTNAYGPWQYYATGTHYNMSQYGGVQSIVAASDYRGIAGELFAIGGSGRLFDFIP